MFHLKYPTEQSDPPRSPKETLPTMYDLPSENLEEPGLPDEFHTLQPRLLDATCYSPYYASEQIFKGTDINLYYDVHHQLWYKRPDWFIVTGVDRLYENTDLRLSYVMWQEGISPLVVIEFLSPGTETEDLGEQVQSEDVIDATAEKSETGAIEPSKTKPSDRMEKDKPPRKWEVYERILHVPYYVVFSRYRDRLRVFTLVGERYQEVALDPDQPKIWIPGLGLGLGLWQGEFEGISRRWLRWYDTKGNWIPTQTEQALQRAEQAETRLEQTEARLEQTEARLEQERLEKERLLERLRQLEEQ